MQGSLPSRQWPYQFAGLLAAGLLLGAASPEFGSWPWLAPLAFAPWFAVLARTTVVGATLSGLAMGLVYIVPGRWEIIGAGLASAGHTGLGALALQSAFFLCYALPFALFAVIDAWQRRHWPIPASIQALARAGSLTSLILIAWSPFDYTPVAALLAEPLWLQPASMGGEALLLFLLLWPSAVLGGVLADWRLGACRRLAAPLLVGALLAVFGAWRLASLDAAAEVGEGAGLSAMPLQLDLPIGADALLMLRAQSRGRVKSAVELTTQGLAAAPHCELIVWPEIPLSAAETQRVCAQADTLAGQWRRPWLQQCHEQDAQREAITAEWRAADGSASQHRKSALVPHYERALWGVQTLVVGEPGTVFKLDARRRIIPALCFELHSRRHIRAGVLAGGNVIAHQVNYAAFGRFPIDVMERAAARIRAVEFGVPILRASNRGPIGWIDAGGREHLHGERFGYAAPCLDLWLPDRQPTLYIWIAPWADLMPGLLALSLLLGFARRAGIDMRPRRP